MIDAVHPEETRIVITDGDRVREFDYESTVKKQLKGNIYLAKITRVEPSLQAAFVDYGGDKHGFLPFSEIHPDYFQLPVEAKKELLASLNASYDEPFEEEVDEAFDVEDDEVLDQDKEFYDEGEEEVSEQLISEEEASDGHNENVVDGEISSEEIVRSESQDDENLELDQSSELAESVGQEDIDTVKENENGYGQAIEIAEGSDSEDDEEVGNPSASTKRNRKKRSASSRQRSVHKQYKINEVIKRGQLVQVQVIKEERGNKGASLTSYVSLAGRYCVFMPRSNGQGGVSRRITNYDDRKRLKEYLSDIGVNNNQGSVIVRTAGADKSKEEIQRDYEYLKKLWDDIREMTLASTAPSFIHTEGDIIRRFIKDYFNNTIDEIIIEGENAYRAARGFVKMIMPSSVKKVRRHRYKTPIFTKYGVENQIMQLYKNTAHMPSGGYIVINPTEALISIDVNSGKSTSGKDVEETALHSNIEAAKEIARQLRLRDLSGLVVIDFIDMISPKNRRLVEKTLKEEFKTDRAKVQIGRISLFGLLEMSRQRLRSNFWEANTVQCSHCKGMGVIRAPESTSVMILRAVEQAIYRGGYKEINVYAQSDVIVYILNYKRDELSSLESRHEARLFLHPDPSTEGDSFRIDKSKNVSSKAKELMPAVNMVSSYDGEEESFEIVDDTDEPVSRHQNNKRKRVSNRRDGSKNRRKRGGYDKKVGANDSSNYKKNQQANDGGPSLLKGLWKSIIG